MGRKHCWKKEKLHLTSNFSFSHSVFKRLAQQTFKYQGLFGKELFFFLSLNSFSMTLRSWILKNMVQKEESKGYEYILLFPTKVF